MRSIGLGDLATRYRTGLQNQQIKTDLARLSQELATGVRSDLKTATGGDLSRYATIRSTLSSLSAFDYAARDAALTTETLQASLGNIRDITTELAPDLLIYGNVSTDPGLRVLAVDARGKFDSVVSTLNTQIAGRSLFAGAAVDGPAVADAGFILAELSNLVSGETSAADVETAIADWFDAPGGGFETLGYLGAQSDLAPARIGAGETADIDIRADDTAIRDLLKGYAMAALVAEGQFVGNEAEQANLLLRAGEQLLSANAQIEDVRADLGVTEEKIENAIARISAERSALEVVEIEIRAVDPYETATELQMAETRLETLYAITARLSRLSLVNFIQ